jgi:CelD/BcsL family acetyltransferase involved in cellulose biosynthesis
MALAVRVARSAEDLAQLHDAWLALRPASIDALPDVFDAVLARDEVQAPHVVVAEDDGTPVALAVARIEERTAEARFGYATLHRTRLRTLTLVHGGTVGAEDDATVEALARALVAAVDAGEADAVFFHKLALDSALHRAVLRAAPARRRQRFLAVDRHWTRELPAGFDTFMSSLKRRKHLKYYVRRLDKEYGDRLELVRLHRPEQLETLLADVEAVASRTYQRGLDAGFHAERDREIVRAGLDAGRYNAWVLKLDGAPVAFEYGELLGGTYFLGGKGYLPELADKSLGNYVALAVLREIIGSGEARRIDFGFGDADYKRSFGDGGWDEADLTVYAGRPRPMAVNALHSAIVGADRAARRAAGRDRVAKVKARWRARRVPTGESRAAGDATPAVAVPARSNG